MTLERQDPSRGQGWARRLPVLARLEIVMADRSGGGAGVVSIRMRSQSTQLAVLAAVMAFTALVGWSFLHNSGRWVVYGLPLLWGVNWAISRRRRTVVLTDPVLGRAAARAAQAFGRELKPGRWVIEGPAADELGSDLTRLHNWWTMPGHAAFGDRAREEALLDAARPTLRSFMRPSADELEPDHPESSSHEPGQPWPTLENPTGGWPMMPPEKQNP